MASPASPVLPISEDEQRVRDARRDDPGIDDLLPVLDAALAALDASGADHLLMGGIASSCHGRQRWTHDIDVFTRPEQAGRALDALAAAGFATEETFAEWLYKATRDGQCVDLIFRSGGGITVDDEMLARAPTVDFLGRQVRILPPEDLVVIKAIVAAEHQPRHWHDALAVIATADLDWDYLLRRSRFGVRRVLALLLYAQSDDLPVPWAVVRRAFDQLEGA